MKVQHYKLRLDSDGVLADWNARVNEICGCDFTTIPKSRVWSKIGFYNKTVAPFYESLEKHTDADALVEFAIAHFENVEILTATGSTPHDAAQQKVNWYQKHYPFLKVNTVKGSENKAQFAESNIILVDDKNKALDPWIAAGGIGVLHTDTVSTVKQLQEFLSRL
jgi:5'(3')-deoxyribonucleotidase